MGSGRRRERSRTTRVSEMAEFAGVSEQAFRKWMKLPGFPIAPDNSVCLWDLAVWRERLAGSDEIDGEPSGSDSPALERYREARASQEEIRLLQMQGEFVPLEDVHAALNETAVVMKATAERIMRDAGNEFAQMLNDAWDEVQKRIERLFGDDRTGGAIGGPKDAP
jgi:hypothetical protein